MMKQRTANTLRRTRIYRSFDWASDVIMARIIFVTGLQWRSGVRGAGGQRKTLFYTVALHNPNEWFATMVGCEL